MKITKLTAPMQRKCQAIIKQYARLRTIVNTLSAADARVLLVGGAVRDLLLKRPVKDIDIEVHGLALSHLQKILRTFGPVSLVGKAYGVLRVHGLDVDWSLPRTETAGRKPQVTVDPNLSITQAFERRDLTINALGIDLKTYELLDPFGGYQDLQDGVLRATNPQRFGEDPLRFYRVMQFVGRFQMAPDDELNELCAGMDVSTVSVERIEREFDKLFLSSIRPSLGIWWLYEIDRLDDTLPELAATIDVPQNPFWHPEGDVFIHTMQAIDAAAVLEYDSEQQKRTIMYAVLCHDLGKVTTTRKIDGVWRALGHAPEGVAPTKSLLKRITRNKELIAAVCKLVKYHMMPGQLVGTKAKPPAYKRLANKLAPDVTLQDLALVSLADKRGRRKNSDKPLTRNFSEITQFLKRAEKAQVLATTEPPVLQGRDFMDVVKPGPKMGRLVKKAYEFQIEQGITNKAELKKKVLRWAKRYAK